MTTDLVQSIAQCLQSDPTASVEVLVERLKSDDRLIQFNTGNAPAFTKLDFSFEVILCHHDP
jgi:hypothetical protein